jgi:nitroreductase
MVCAESNSEQTYLSLELMNMPLSIAELNEKKHAPDVEGVLPVFHQRWSPRAFADRPVATADLAKVFDAARWAASSYNEQPWRFILGVRGSETYKKILATMMPFNQQWAGKAPVLILGIAKPKFSHNDTPNRVALFDLGAASSYLTLEAAALGLVTHQMGGFDADAAKKSFSIPEDHVVGSIIALGYQAEPAALHNEQMEAQEVAPRTRKPLSEIVLSAWDQSADLG